MMKKKNTLSVKPLRRYNTPAYPSYLDKNPIEHPDTLPYPFTYKALQVLAGAGILVGASCAPTKQVSDNLSATQLETVQDSLVNPFTFEKLSLPFRAAMFGTGMPERLKSDEARTVINKVFQEEGINLEKDYYYKKDSIAVVLDGFDSDLNIGYVWVDWNKMGDGMIVRWNAVYYEEILRQCFLTYTINSMYEIETLIEGTLKSDEDYVSSFREPFESAKKIERDEERLLVYKEIYLDLNILLTNKSDNQVNTQLLKDITSQSSFKEKKDTYIKFMLMSRLKHKVKKFEEKTTLIEILDVILQLDNEQEKAKQYDNLIEFIKLHQGNKSKKIENSRTQQILNLQNKKKIAEEIQAFANDHLDKKLSLQETKYLENIHHSEKDFIAPIGVRDIRFSYHHSFPIFTKEEQEKIDKIRLTGDEEELLRVSDEILKVANKRKPQDQALKALETQVRQYIRWAKQQGKH